MGVADPRARSGPSQSVEIEAIRKDLAQLRRLIQNLPKTPPSVGGGGWAWASSSGAALSLGATSKAIASAWTISSSGDDPVILHDNAGGFSENRLGVDRAGFYTITANMVIQFGASAPTTVRGGLRGVAHATGGAGSDIHARQTTVPVDSSGRASVSVTIAGSIDPVLYDGILPDAFWVGSFAPSVDPSFTVDVVRH